MPAGEAPCTRANSAVSKAPGGRILQPAGRGGLAVGARRQRGGQVVRAQAVAARHFGCDNGWLRLGAALLPKGHAKGGAGCAVRQPGRVFFCTGPKGGVLPYHTPFARKAKAGGTAARLRRARPPAKVKPVWESAPRRENVVNYWGNAARLIRPTGSAGRGGRIRQREVEGMK